MRNLRKFVVLKTTFPATHCWPECPIEEVNYLKYQHRHLFYVVMKFRVDHNDRDIEFIKMKMDVEEYIRENFYNKYLGRTSCEDIGEELMQTFQANFVSVFEDNENGAEIYGQDD
jgi:hypothetical protein